MASYIKERTKNAQFIVISLRNNMFELASRLVGVYKVNHMVSAPMSIELDPADLSAADQECNGRKQGLHHWTGMTNDDLAGRFTVSSSGGLWALPLYHICQYIFHSRPRTSPPSSAWMSPAMSPFVKLQARGRQSADLIALHGVGISKCC